MGEEERPRRITYSVTSRDRGRRLDLFLKERIPRMSRERIKEAIRSRVEVAGRGSIRPSTELADGDRVIVTWPDTEQAAGEGGGPGASIPPVPVIHEDRDLLAVDKPAGLLVHGTTSSRGPTLLGALSDRGPLHLVHRLDRETSGVVLLGRTRQAARSLSGAFAAGRASKRYLAVVFGRIPEDEGWIDLPIGPATASAVHVKQGVNRESGHAALTRYRVLDRLDRFTFVELEPATGRRHQIRVHLHAIGHPVVGDKLYGPRESHHLRFLASGFDERMRKDLLAERQLLHAHRLEVAHPRSGRRMVFEAPLPPDMAAFLEGTPLD